MARPCQRRKGARGTVGINPSEPLLIPTRAFARALTEAGRTHLRATVRFLDRLLTMKSVTCCSRSIRLGGFGPARRWCACTHVGAAGKGGRPRDHQEWNAAQASPPMALTILNDTGKPEPKARA
jgi:hypothetical protein